jgi:hypothetical protein
MKADGMDRRVARMEEMIYSYKVLFGKPDGRARCRWEEVLKYILKNRV